MNNSRRNLITCLLLTCLTVGCGLHGPVLKSGGNGRKGVLLNYSCGARPCDPIDPGKPTIVITHGWNPLPNLIHTTFGSSGAKAIKCRCGDTYNILSWDWNGVRVPPLPKKSGELAREQGRMMAAALRCRGVIPGQTQIISHSLGTIAASQAAICLSDRGPMAQITLLDPPKQFHRMLFEKLKVTRYACSVENYWSPGVSGFGAPADYAGVRSYCVKGAHPIRGIFDLSVSNHVNVMTWYHKTIMCPSIPSGFQNSVFRNYCNPCCQSCLPAEEVCLPVLVEEVESSSPNS
jgi:hypothetical protein